MQAINKAAPSPLFMLLLFGTGAACVALMVFAAMNIDEPGSTMRLIAGAIYVAGVVRPEDIRSDNKIDYAQIAELRVAYGGRGQLTDVQQPRYGAQVLDIILPY